MAVTVACGAVESVTYIVLGVAMGLNLIPCFGNLNRDVGRLLGGSCRCWLRMGGTLLVVEW